MKMDTSIYRWCLSYYDYNREEKAFPTMTLGFSAVEQSGADMRGSDQDGKFIYGGVVVDNIKENEKTKNDSERGAG
jgi:hypothetical protein